MKARYIGIIFVAAVLVPSILLSVLSIRSTGREEAYVEKQLATTLLAEVTHTASLVNAGVAELAGELHASAAFPPGRPLQLALPTWKERNVLVGVPYALSPMYRIIWPRPGSEASKEERTFLQQNVDFLSGKSATAVYANIAVVHREQILAEARRLDESQKTPAGQGAAATDSKRTTELDSEPLAETSAASGAVSTAADAVVPGAKGASATGGVTASSVEPLESQQAIDTFAQSPVVQEKVYQEALQQGEQLNARVARPTSRALETAPDIAPARQEAKSDGGPSQYITTSRFFRQIASEGEFGIIPRFIGDKLAFLFWDRRADGTIIGCEIALAEFRRRVAAILPSTYSPVRILTVLDESGQPLSTLASGVSSKASRDWRRPFVSQEIGPSLPRWEVASYLTDPDSITNQARSTSAVIWILVLILFISVAGGGTMVLSSLYGEMRLAQQKASFVANVSHELKTPLSSISLFVDLLRRKRPPDPKKRDRYLAMMAAETERLGRLINNVLDFSSREKGERNYSVRRVGLAQVAKEVVDGQRVRLEGLGFTVRLSLSASADETNCDADAEALKQVLLNLLSNAEKYSPEKKEIDVEVARAGADVAVHVRDRGLGVSEKDRERIFQEFIRVNDSLTARVPGTGLGLTIARRIVRDHGGDLMCKGREGGGSDFVLQLPRAVADSKEMRE
jgi:signal transduction histidine kinase